MSISCVSLRISCPMRFCLDARNCNAVPGSPRTPPGDDARERDYAFASPFATPSLRLRYAFATPSLRLHYAIARLRYAFATPSLHLRAATKSGESDYPLATR